MHSVLRQPHRPLRYHLQPSQIRRNATDSRPFAAGDLVLLHEKLNRNAHPIFTRPLRPGRNVQSHRGVIWHDDIIGKRVRDVVSSRTKSKKEEDNAKPTPGTEFRIHQVKLEDYVRLTKRLVTPVYPADAAVIVDLLDLHPGAIHRGNDADNDEHAPKLEILEAGTGHGALTLHISRAIHAANTHLPFPDPNDLSAIESWKSNRKAILHTIEAKSKYSLHAREVVAGFRNGLYHANVDFHISPVSDWVRQALADRNDTPFLSHAILDLPNADQQLADVAAALRLDGTCVVFNPSLTQILTCVKKVKEDRIPFELEAVIELPSNGGARGREWDVRAVRPRATVAAAELESSRDGDLGGVEVDAEGGDALAASLDVDTNDGPAAENVPAITEETEKGDWHMVCRPKVGDRIVGGGFLGVFKKWRDTKVAQ